MTFSARQVLTAAQLNDLSIDTLTTTGNVTVGGTLTATISGAGSDTQFQYNNGGVLGGASGLTYNDGTGVVVATTGLEAGYVGKSFTGAYTYITAWPSDGNWIAVNGGNGYLLLDGNYADDDIYLRSWNNSGRVNIGAGNSNTLQVDNGALTVNGTGTFTGDVTTDDLTVNCSSTELKVQGSIAGVQFMDRDGDADRFVVYNSGNVLRFYNGADLITMDSSGELSALRLRLSSTTDASLSSTGHAFQVGPTNSQNIIMDNNEIQARSNGVANTLYLNFDGGDIYAGGGVTATGRVRSEGPDGGGVMRYWTASTLYVMFGTANMAGQEYSVLTDGISTYISCGAGGATYIRGPANDTVPEIINNGTNVQITGNALFENIAFIGDEDTGVYRPGADQVALGAGGVACLNAISGTVNTASPATATTSGYQYVLRNNTFGTLYRFTSAGELKEQVATFDDSGSIIDALRPVTFIPKFVPGRPTPEDQIDEYDPTVETEAQRLLREADLQFGFIAEEVAGVANGKLGQYEWADDGELKATGWKWPDLIAVLTAEVKSLRVRVATLEGAAA